MVLTAEQHHPNIKIFVSAHKQATFPEGNSIVPVQVGAANLKNPCVCRDIVRALPAEMARCGIENLTDIIGGAHNG